MKKLIVASNNQGKIKEIKKILSQFNLEIVSLKDEGIDIDVVEDGTTFMENSYKKAKTIYDVTGEMVIADDSGLCVEALNGAPGIYSARFCGEHGNDKKNNEKLLKLLINKNTKEERKAKFVCSIVLIINSEKVIKVKGEVQGYIIDEERGKSGFGYDPLFYVPELKKTFGEASEGEKNSISHRGRALKELEDKLKEVDFTC
ncbi:MAG: XTP/dITP diphosphatase [Clostridium sp.]|nr:XTP/dITP diphosphatase [Clostridium sp.]